LKGFDQLPNARRVVLPEFDQVGLHRAVEAPRGAIELLKRMLDYDPGRRITAVEALRHGFFEVTSVQVCLTELDGRRSHWLVLWRRCPGSLLGPGVTPRGTSQTTKE